MISSSLAVNLHNLLTLSKRTRYTLGFLLACGTGAMQFLVFFPDNPPAIVLLLVGAVSLAGGVALGAVVAGLWAGFGALGCWGAVLAGLLVLRGSGSPYGYYLIVTAGGSVFLGGMLGAAGRLMFRKKRCPPTN